MPWLDIGYCVGLWPKLFSYVGAKSCVHFLRLSWSWSWSSYDNDLDLQYQDRANGHLSASNQRLHGNHWLALHPVSQKTTLYFGSKWQLMFSSLIENIYTGFQRKKKLILGHNATYHFFFYRKYSHRVLQKTNFYLGWKCHLMFSTWLALLWVSQKTTYFWVKMRTYIFYFYRECRNFPPLPSLWRTGRHI